MKNSKPKLSAKYKSNLASSLLGLSITLLIATFAVMLYMMHVNKKNYLEELSNSNLMLKKEILDSQKLSSLSLKREMMLEQKLSIDSLKKVWTQELSFTGETMKKEMLNDLTLSIESLKKELMNDLTLTVDSLDMIMNRELGNLQAFSLFNISKDEDSEEINHEISELWREIYYLRRLLTRGDYLTKSKNSAKYYDERYYYDDSFYYDGNKVVWNKLNKIIYENMKRFSTNLPKPSTYVELPNSTFSNCEYMLDISELLSKMLDSCGYERKSFFRMSGGFVMATQIEQINFDGSAKSREYRWSSTIEPAFINGFSLSEYFKSLFSSTPGYHRSFLFVVSNENIRLSGDEPDFEDVLMYIDDGFIELPESISKIEVDHSFSCYVLIYRFEKKVQSDKMNLVIPDPISGSTHLKEAGIWNQITKQ